MKKLLSSAVCCLALLAGSAAIPDPPHMPKRLPKVCEIGGKAAEIRGNTAAVVIAPDAPKTVRFAAKELATKIDGHSVRVPIKIGENGRVFGSVSVKEVGEAIKEQLGLDIDKKKITLPIAIKNEGVVHAAVKLHPQVTAELEVVVEGVK